MGCAALCGVESGARRHGGEAGTMEMVQCRGAPRLDGPEPAAGNGTLAKAMDGCGVAAIPRGRRIGSRVKPTAAIHAHRAPIGDCGFRGGSGGINFASARSAKREGVPRNLQRTTDQANSYRPLNFLLRFGKTGERPVCPQVSRTTWFF